MRKSLFGAAVALLSVVLAACSDEPSTGADSPAQLPPASQRSEINTASEQLEVRFSVPGMSCPMCPITVRKALAGVDGVTEAETSLKDRQARVVFDPTRTNVDTLIAAVAEAGFEAMAQDSDHDQ
jgi:mercuric ion binding protein